MNIFYPFFRLAWRPAVLLWGSFVLPIVTVELIDVGPATLGRLIAGEAGTSDVQGTARMTAFLFPTFIGLLVGRIVKELQHCEFAWHLPGIRTKLAVSVLAVAAICAVPSAVLYWGAPGNFVWLAMVILALLLFGMATALFDPIPSPLVSRLSLVMLVIMALRLEDVTRAFESQPVIAGTLAAFGAASYFVREFSRGAARQRPFVPTCPLGTGGEGRWMRERMSQRSVQSRDWALNHLGTKLVNWMRATEYEAYGYLRFGWVGRTVTIATIIVVALVFAASELLGVAIIVAIAAIAQHFLGSSFLRKRIHRPLSRSQRAAVAFWSSFVNNAGLCLVLVTLLAVAHAFGPSFTSLPGRLPEVSGVIWPAVFVFTWTPLLQWVQVRHLDCERTQAGALIPAVWMIGASTIFYLLVIASAIAAANGVSVLGISATQWGGVAAAGAALAISGLVQLAYWLRLQRFFRTADLV